MQTSPQERQKLTTLRGLLTTVAIHGHPVAFGDGQCAFHQSSMPSEPEPVYAEPVPQAQADSSNVWLCKKAFQGLMISPQAWEHTQKKKKINDMDKDQLLSDPLASHGCRGGHSTTGASHE